jgi:hypothetical protein
MAKPEIPDHLPGVIKGVVLLRTGVTRPDEMDSSIRKIGELRVSLFKNLIVFHRVLLQNRKAVFFTLRQACNPASPNGA